MMMQDLPKGLSLLMPTWPLEPSLREKFRKLCLTCVEYTYHNTLTPDQVKGLRALLLDDALTHIGPKEHGSLYLLMKENTPVATLIAEPYDVNTVILRSLFVHPDWQGKKLGTFLAQWAQSKPWKTVLNLTPEDDLRFKVNVAVATPKARAFWKKQNYITFGYEKIHINPVTIIETYQMEKT